MATIAAGTVLDGRYEVLRLLGEGGMASVYLVRHLGLHSEHALKVLNPELYVHEDVRARFLAEGRIQASIRHPNIVAVTEIVSQPVAGLVMDYVPGMTLGDHLARNGPFKDFGEATRLFLEILDAVGEAHDHGVVHRDLKPDNIILARTKRGQLQARVTDFGIARVAEHGGRPRTRTGARMGTPQYMSPEQVRGAENTDARSDIFALGAILYEMVTGTVAFSGKSDFDTMQAVVAGSYLKPEQLVPELPRNIRNAIVEALALNPDNRFASCEEFGDALRSAGGPRPAVAVPRPPLHWAPLRPQPVTESPRLEQGEPDTRTQGGAPTTLWQIWRGSFTLYFVCWTLLCWLEAYGRNRSFPFELWLAGILASSTITALSVTLIRISARGPLTLGSVAAAFTFTPLLALPASFLFSSMNYRYLPDPGLVRTVFWIPIVVAVWLHLSSAREPIAHPGFLGIPWLIYVLTVNALVGEGRFSQQVVIVSVLLFTIWMMGTSLLAESALSGTNPENRTTFLPPLGPRWKTTWPFVAIAAAILLLLGVLTGKS